MESVKRNYQNGRNGEVHEAGSRIINHKMPSNSFSRAADLAGTELQGPPFKPLTPLRALRGVLSLIVLLSTAFVMLVFLAPICCVLVRAFSCHYSRQLVAFFFGRWLAMWPFLFENINGTKIVFTGDKVPEKERAIVICNHRTEVDWMYIWNLALRKDRIGYVKYVIKNSVRNVPVFGWALYAMEFLLIERKWELDEPLVERYVSSFADRRDPLWLVLFPEGTDFTERKKLASQEFAERNGLPTLNHVLLPRTKGFLGCLNPLRKSLDAVYDITIAYKHRYPLFIHNLVGTEPAEVHMHIRRVPVQQIPESEEASSSWLYSAYEKKDQLLAAFYRRGYFSNADMDLEGQLDTLQFLFNFSLVIGCTVVFSYIIFFTSAWAKLYAVLSSVYLSLATYFNWRPSYRSSKND